MTIGAIGGILGDEDSIEGASDAGQSNLDDFTETASAVGGSRRTGTSAGGGGNLKRTSGPGGDLRKKALKNNRTEDNRVSRRNGGGRLASSPPPTRPASPAPSDVAMGDLESTPIAGPSGGTSAGGESEEIAMADLNLPAGGNGGENGDVTMSPSVEPGEQFESSNPGTPEPLAGGLGNVDVITTTTAVDLTNVVLPELIVPIDERPRKVDVRRRWNFFANSNLYCIVRLLQVSFLFHLFFY